MQSNNVILIRTCNANRAGLTVTELEANLTLFLCSNQ